MGIRVASITLALACVAGASSALADTPPEKRARAASHYDAGAAAFKKKDYEGAAAHFEEADAALPSAGALRQAIRARSEAGQAARAATLALLALERYPRDAALGKVARDAIEKYEIVLHKIHVVCGAPCTIAVGQQSVPGAPRVKWTVYLDPGQGSITATFDDEGASSSVSKDIDAKAGGESDLHLDPKKAAPPPVVAPVVAPPKAEVPPEDPKPDAKDEKDKTDEPRKGISPAFFAVGAAAFVGLGAATIWSGVDTIHNPGQAAVRAQCTGLGTSCPAYQEGLAHQTRTNVLAGLTGGTAAVTIVLGIFTNWHGSKKQPDDKQDTTTAEPTAIITDRGGVFGARGVF